MSKHTPGEWKFGVRRDNSIWLSLGDPRKGPHYQGDLYASEADARLIAAAPDLLAALKEAVEIIEKHVPRDALGVDHMGDFSVPGGVMTWGVLDEHLHYMRKAIDKAEGRP